MTDKPNMPAVDKAAPSEELLRSTITRIVSSYVDSPMLVDELVHSLTKLQPQGRCPYCDDTGDVHGLDGEWRGTCTECPAGKAPTALLQQALAALRIARDNWKATKELHDACVVRELEPVITSLSAALA